MQQQYLCSYFGVSAILLLFVDLTVTFSKNINVFLVCASIWFLFIAYRSPRQCPFFFCVVINTN